MCENQKMQVHHCCKEKMFQVEDLNDRQVTVGKDMIEIVEIEHIQLVKGMEMVATTTIAVVNRDRFVRCGNFYVVTTLVRGVYQYWTSRIGSSVCRNW